MSMGERVNERTNETKSRVNEGDDLVGVLLRGI